MGAHADFLEHLRQDVAQVPFSEPAAFHGVFPKAIEKPQDRKAGPALHALVSLARASLDPLPGIGVICETQSFPRKRESTPQTFGDVLPSDWIPPAMAGRE